MFRFKLDPLLRHRKHLEEECQKELAALQQTLAQETARLDALHGRRAGAESRLRTLQAGKTDVPAILDTMAYLRRLEGEIGAQEKTVETARLACENQRCELVAAMKGRKIIEKLKEKGHTAHRAEEVRNHQNFMNEIAINRFTRDH